MHLSTSRTNLDNRSFVFFSSSVITTPKLYTKIQLTWRLQKLFKEKCSVCTEIREKRGYVMWDKGNFGLFK